MKVVYKITYPNGKIYVGMDLNDTLTYFGSVDSELVEADFSRADMRHFKIRTQILRESETASDYEVRAKEIELITQLRSNQREIGYNRWPGPRKNSPDR